MIICGGCYINESELNAVKRSAIRIHIIKGLI